MSLQRSVEDLINPLDSLSYLSSEDEMEVDDGLSFTEIDGDNDNYI